MMSGRTARWLGLDLLALKLRLRRWSVVLVLALLLLLVAGRRRGGGLQREDLLTGWQQQ